jgi:branched-chain amino acid transport system substrate-binding protein
LRTTKLLTALLVCLMLFAAACSSDSDSSDDAAPADDTSAAEEPAVEEPAAEEPAAEEPAPEEPAAEEPAATDGSWDIDAALAADPDCADPVTGEGLIIGYAADFSDLGGFADGPASAAAEHFVEQINCSGGVGGVPVSLVIQDISGDPETTARASQDLIGAGVHAILGPPFPDFGFPLLQETAGQVPVLFTASTEPALSDPAAQSYLVAFDDTQQATAAAQFSLDQGWTTAVTFSAPGPYFGYNPEVFTEVFEAGGGTVISDYNFVPIDDVDFSTQVNEIANGEIPDVIYSAMLSFQTAALKSQMEGAGIETNYLVTDAFEATGGYFTDGVDGVYHTTHAAPGPDTRVAKLDETFTAATGAPLENPSFGGLAVDGIAVIIDAFLRTGSTDPAVIGAAIADATNVQGATGVLTYNGTGTPTKPVYVHQVVDGQATLAATIG